MMAAVIVSRGLWRGFDVQVIPPAASHPLRYFRNRDGALEAARDIATAEGWLVTDHTEEVDGAP